MFHLQLRNVCRRGIDIEVIVVVWIDKIIYIVEI